MAAPTIRDLPEAPARTMGPDEFSNKADAFLAELQPWGQEVEAAGELTETKAGEAVTARDEAVAARDAVSADAGIWSSTTEGLSNSSDGQHFQVINTDEIAIYRNDSGSATLITSYPATAAFGTSAFQDLSSDGGVVPKLEETTVELGGDFSAGESVKIVKMGPRVDIQGIGESLGHSNMALPGSASGVIPTSFRPSDEGGSLVFARNTYASSVDPDGTGNRVNEEIRVSSNGDLFIAYTDDAGQPSAQGNSSKPFLSYLIE